MSKKLVLTLLSTSLIAIAGCGTVPTSSSSGSSTPSSESSSETPKTQISFWHNCNSTTEALFGNFVEAFEALNPDIDIELKKETGSYDDLKKAVVTGISAGNYPDLFYGYPDAVSEIMGYGKVVQLDSYMSNPTYGWTSEDYEDIIPAYLEEGKQYQMEGTFSVPFAKSTEAMYYNADVLIGLNLSAYDETINGGNSLDANYLSNLTWEELFDKLCPAIEAYNDDLPSTDKIWDNSGDYYAIFAWSGDDNAFITLAQQYENPYTSVDTITGVGSIDFNDESNKTMVKKFFDATKKHYFMTSKVAGGSYTNTLFTKKKSLFDIGSTGGIQYYSGSNNTLVNIGMTNIPHAEGHDKKVINQGPSLAILNHNDEERALAAWRFYKFMTDPIQNDAFARTTGYSPIRYSVYESSDWAEYQSLEGKTKKSLEYNQALCARYVPTVTEDLYSSPVFKGSATARTEVGAMFGGILNLASWDEVSVNEKFATAENNSKLAC